MQHGAQCGLTPRSRRGPTSKPQARAVGWRILHRTGLGFCCWSRLSSNVRHHKMRCVPSAAQNSRMHSRPHSSHPSGAATGEVPGLRRNMLARRYHSKNCSKDLRASRAAIVVPETVAFVQFIKPAADAGQESHFQSVSCTSTPRQPGREDRCESNFRGFELRSDA